MVVLLNIFLESLISFFSGFIKELKRFGMTWRWVNYEIFIFSWSIPLKGTIPLGTNMFLCLDCGRTLAVYEQSESSRISSKIFVFVFRRWAKVLQVWNDMRESKLWKFSFWGENKRVLVSLLLHTKTYLRGKPYLSTDSWKKVSTVNAELFVAAPRYIICRIRNSVVSSIYLVH